MPSTAGYDAFISYSRLEDGWLAPALQSGLERFAKPWYRVRGLRVFRDKASLAASPELWGSIESALRDSRWLILLASPEAARSAWVDREVAWWLANKSADRILVVTTSGRLRWDKQAGDWAEGAPVPPSLRGAFRAEPLWADLTSVRAGRHRVRLSDEDLASVAAPLRGVDRDTLIGEHLRQHRRTMRVVRSVIATLTALLLFAVAATVVAVGQRDEARTEARIATARELAALSGSMVGSNLDIAQLLAVAAYQTDRDPQTEGALVQAAAASPQLVHFLQAGSAVTALASSADGTTVVVGTTDGDLMAFDLATGRRSIVHATSGAVTELSVSADGHAVAAMDVSQAVTWTPGVSRAVPISGVRQPADVAVSPSGGQAIVLQGYAARTTSDSDPRGVRKRRFQQCGVPVQLVACPLQQPRPVAAAGPGQPEDDRGVRHRQGHRQRAGGRCCRGRRVHGIRARGQDDHLAHVRYGATRHVSARHCTWHYRRVLHDPTGRPGGSGRREQHDRRRAAGHVPQRQFPVRCTAPAHRQQRH